MQLSRRVTAVGVSIAEAAPQHPHLCHGVEGAGRVVALARNVRELGEVDPQVGELPQLCWGPRRGVRGLQEHFVICVEGLEQETEASARRAAAESAARTKGCSLTPPRHQGSSRRQLKTPAAEDLLPHGVTPAQCSPSHAGRAAKRAIPFSPSRAQKRPLTYY